MSAATGLAKLLYDGAALDPSATAVLDGQDSYTYADLIGRVEACGGALQQRLPAAGSRVAICADNHPEHLVAYLATLVAGHVWVPLNPANGRGLNSVIAAKARPNLMLVGEESTNAAPDVTSRLMLGELGAAPDAFELHAAAADEVAAIKFTGGTSGEPKGVVQTHANMLAVIENMQAFYEFRNTDCNLAVAPLTHGSSHYLFPVLAAGSRHRFLRDRSAASILAAMREDTSIVFMPPTLIYKLMREPGLSPGQFPALRHLTYSAAPMPAERIADAQRAFGPCISALYGLTEAPVTICALGPEEMQEPELRRTAGRPCANSRVRIVDGAGEAVRPGTTGHVEASGPIVMRGYLDEPELTAAAFHDGWLRTGDLGSLDDNGYLTLAGRAGEVIISGGFNVYPAEVENVLAKLPGVRECCVFAVEDDYWGERVDAAVVIEPGVKVTEADVTAFVKAELGPVRTPKTVHFVDGLPRNAVGKVVRRDMPKFVAA